MIVEHQPPLNRLAVLPRLTFKESFILEESRRDGLNVHSLVSFVNRREKSVKS